MPRGAENREAGESPARSRHCKQESIAIMSLSYREGSNGCLNCEPGDLPDCGTGNIRFQVTRIGCTECMNIFVFSPDFSFSFVICHNISI